MVRYARRLLILCRKSDGSRTGIGEGAEMDRDGGPDRASRKDANRGCHPSWWFDFLGYHFEQGMKWPRRKSLTKFKDAIRAKTPRTHGRSLSATIAEVNRTLVGWFEYFKHSHRNTFPRLDGWVRMRLRSILRKRRGDLDEDTGRTITAGPTHSLLSRGCIHWWLPMRRSVNPMSGKTTNWKAGCGKSAVRSPPQRYRKTAQPPERIESKLPAH